MCGRVRVVLPDDLLLGVAQGLGAAGPSGRSAEREGREAGGWDRGWDRARGENLQPSCAAPVVVLRRDDGSARVETMKVRACSGRGELTGGLTLGREWGLVPSWHGADRPANHFAMFNARSETVRGLKSFSGPLRRKQRCLVLVNGFYEWRTETAVGNKKVKQPYYVRPAEGEFFAMAGLWDEWQELKTFTVLTRDACADLAWLHDRMPVILGAEEMKHWLEADDPDLEKLAARTYKDRFVTVPVTTRMNKALYQGSDCSLEAERAVVQGTGNIRAFFGKKEPAAKVLVKWEMPPEPKASPKPLGVQHRPLKKSPQAPSPAKKKKKKLAPAKGTIAAFFSPKGAER